MIRLELMLRFAGNKV